MRVSLAVHSSILGFLLVSGLASALFADDVIYVDPRQGNDAFDGSTPKPINVRSGPVKTIRRALELVDTGNTIVLKNNGVPYFESLQLVGKRHSGIGNSPLLIVGNGAVIDGSRPVPSAAWKQQPSNIWKMTPWRKGSYQLLLDGNPVPEFDCPPNAKTLPAISEGRWCAYRGSMYYRAAGLEYPPEMPFWFAYNSVGLTLYKVHNVRIQDVTFRNFRLDGINAHDLCDDIVLENVTSKSNGRAGLFLGGTSHVQVQNCDLRGNRRYSLLIRGLAGADIKNAKLDKPPVFLDN